jgi:hypothetical protein
LPNQLAFAVASFGSPLMTPQFHIGQTVYLQPSAFASNAAGMYEIRAVLPEEEGRHRYRIRAARARRAEGRIERGIELRAQLRVHNAYTMHTMRWQVWSHSTTMVQSAILLEKLSGEISRQAHAGQRPSATVVGFLKGRNLASPLLAFALVNQQNVQCTHTCPNLFDPKAAPALQEAKGF